MRIGYFCTAGYTEVNGIEPFLRRIDASVEWSRQFPALRRPGGKPPRSDRADHRTISGDEGATGELLIRRMVERVRDHEDDSVDAWLVIDDEDCRLCPKPAGDGPDDRARADSQLLALAEGILLRVRQAGARTRPLVVLLAAPEIEAWLLADRAGLRALLTRRHGGTSGHELDVWVEKTTAGAPIEAFGCPRQGGSCSTKLSAALQGWIAELPTVEPGAHRGYSKRFDGPELLRQLEPDVVARRCPLYFTAAIRRIRVLVEGRERPDGAGAAHPSPAHPGGSKVNG